MALSLKLVWGWGKRCFTSLPMALHISELLSPRSPTSKCSAQLFMPCTGEPLPNSPPQGLSPRDDDNRVLSQPSWLYQNVFHDFPSAGTINSETVEAQRRSMTWPLIQKGRFAFKVARKEELNPPFQL